MDLFPRLVGSRSYESFVDEKRAEAAKDDIFEFGSNNLEREDVRVKDDTPHYEKTKSMSDEEFETYKSQAKDAGLQWTGSSWAANDKIFDQFGVADPVEVNRDRPKENLQNDQNRRATLTTDVDKYASNPDEYDFPLLDTPDEYNDNITTFGMSSDFELTGEDADPLFE